MDRDSVRGFDGWKIGKRRLTAQRGPDANIQRKYSYDYDRYGNRWAQTVVAGSGYGGSNTFDSATNRITTASFAHDGSGNLTANGPATSYTYDQEDRMVSAAAGSVSYVMDAQGRRKRQTAGGVTTEYFYSGSEVIAEKRGTALGGVWTDYVFWGDQRVAQVNAGPANPGYEEGTAGEDSAGLRRGE